MKHLVGENLQTVRQQTALACQASGRNLEEIQLLLATKTVPLEKLQIAIQAGEVLFEEKTKLKNSETNSHSWNKASRWNGILSDICKQIK